MGKHTRSRAVTNTVRAHVDHVFHLLQGEEHKGESYTLEAWAKAHPGEFYKLAASLVPKQLQHEGGVDLRVVTGVPESEDISDIA